MKIFTLFKSDGGILRRTLLSVACCMAIAAHADLVEGDVYTIALASDTTKALFIENSNPFMSAQVCLWTDTHVPAQQWRLMSTDGSTYSFQNLYSGYFLTYRSGNAKGSVLSLTASVLKKMKWDLQPVDASENVFRLTVGGCTLGASSTTDGYKPTLQTDDPSDKSQEWKLIHVSNPVTEFNVQARDEMLNDFMKQFIRVRPSSRLSFGNGGWSDVETMEVMLDAYDETRNPELRTLFSKLYAYFKQGVGEDWTGGGKNGYAWYGYDFNDDVAWMLITASRAYHLFGVQEYLDDAKRNFDAIYQRAYIPAQGLIRWAEHSGVNDDGSFSINSCVNGPMEVAACYIGMGTGDESYFEKARDLYAKQRTELANMSSGQVYDSYRVTADGTTRTGDRNNWASTYNQGTMMGAAVLLYDHYGDAQYKADAEMIMNYVEKNMCDNSGVIKVCQTVDGDLCGFKGILMRYVRRLVVDCGSTRFLPWMKRNAFRAYNNRNSLGFAHSAWLTKSAEDMMYGSGDNKKRYDNQFFGCSTAVSAAVNVPLYATDSLGNSLTSPYTTIEAEFATLKGGTSITRDKYSSCGLYAGFIGKSRTLSFNYVAPQDGVYDIEVYYMSENDRSMYVSADGSTDAVLYPKSGSWNASQQSTKTVQLKLKKGTNTITVGNNTGDCPNIDKFVISFNASATGIASVKGTAAGNGHGDKWYDLQGRQVSDPAHGVFIHQGKKVVMK